MLKLVHFVTSRNLVLIATNFFSGIILARLLEVTARGELAVVITWATLISTISMLSISEIIIKTESKKLNLIDILVFLVITCLFGGVIYLILEPLFFDENIDKYHFYFLMFIPINMLSAIFLSLLQKHKKFDKLMLVRNLFPIMNILLMIIVHFTFSLNVDSVLKLYLLSNIIVFIFAISYGYEYIDISFCKVKFSEYFRKIPGFHGVTIFVVISSQVDKLIATQVLNLHDLSNFVVASAIPISIANVFVSTSQTLLLPLLNKENISNVLSTSIRIYTWYMLPLFTVGFVTLSKLITLIFGTDYLLASKITIGVGIFYYFLIFRKSVSKSVRGFGLEVGFIYLELAYISFLLCITYTLNYIVMVSVNELIVVNLAVNFIIHIFLLLFLEHKLKLNIYSELTNFEQFKSDIGFLKVNGKKYLKSKVNR